jgi:hypothetical protein
MEKGPAPDLRAAWPEAPRAAAELLASAMAYDPAARPVTAGELAERLSTALEAPPRRRPRALGPQGTQARRPRPPAPAAPHPQGTQARRALPPAPAPRRPERRRPRWRLATFLAALAALVFVGLVVSGALRPSGEGPATTKRPPPARAAPTGGSGAGGGGGPSSAAPTTAAGTVGSTDPSTPAGAVQAFYQRQAAHDFQGAWSLADDSFRAQLQGLDSFASQSRGMRSIAFHRADVVSRSGDAATVAIATTAVHSTHTDHCRGTVDLVRGSTSWLLHQIHIAC